jgi:ATP-binding cassette subfamily B protein
MFTKHQISLIKRIWVHIPRINKSQFIFLLFLTIISAFLDVFSLGAIFPYLGLIISPKIIFNNSITHNIVFYLGVENTDQLILLFTILFVILISISTFFKFFMIYYQSKLSALVASNLSRKSFNNTLCQNYEFHLNQKSSEVIAGVNKANGIAGNTIIPVITIINSTLLILFIFITLTIINPYISIFIIISVLIFYFLVIKVTNNRVISYGKIINHNSTKVIQIIQESLGGIRDVLISRNQEFYSNYYFSKNIPLLKSMGNVDFISTIPKYLLESIAIISLIIFIYFEAKIHGEIETFIPTIAALVVSLQRVLPVIQQLYANITKLKSNESSLKRVLFYLDLKKTEKSDFINHIDLSFKNQIELNSIFFKYNLNSNYVISDLNLTIKKGTKIGFVGESGSGKSTLLDILMGLLNPSYGSILVDNVPLNKNNIENWMNKIANVPQTIFLSDSTIAENIAFGSVKEDVDMNLVKSVCDKAKISKTIESWENSYDTLIGERGVRLSGGQKQRIGIARALYKKTEILILDEATSALDEQTEFEVMSEIEKFGQDITVLIIAHRVTTLKVCDIVCELLNGKLIIYNSFHDYINKETS